MLILPLGRVGPLNLPYVTTFLMTWLKASPTIKKMYGAKGVWVLGFSKLI
jgi:hypothetical protein